MAVQCIKSIRSWWWWWYLLGYVIRQHILTTTTTQTHTKYKTGRVLLIYNVRPETAKALFIYPYITNSPRLGSKSIQEKWASSSNRFAELSLSERERDLFAVLLTSIALLLHSIQVPGRNGLFKVA